MAREYVVVFKRRKGHGKYECKNYGCQEKFKRSDKRGLGQIITEVTSIRLAERICEEHNLSLEGSLKD